MNTSNTNHQQPDLVLEFSKGDYNHAIQCYECAKAWVIETGLAFREDVRGLILRPEHPQSPQEERIVPFDLTGDPNWTIRVQIFTPNEDVLNELKQLPLPEGSTLRDQNANAVH